MPGRVVKAPLPKTAPASTPDHPSTELLDLISQQLHQLNEVALTGLKAMDKPAPTRQPEAWAFDVIRGADGRIKQIKATRG